MKVIGKTEQGYLVEATEEELARVSGFWSAWGDQWKGYLRRLGHRDDRINIGASLPVSEWWQRLDKITTHEKGLADMAKHLRGLADMLDAAWPHITMTLPTEPKGETK